MIKKDEAYYERLRKKVAKEMNKQFYSKPNAMKNSSDNYNANQNYSFVDNYMIERFKKVIIKFENLLGSGTIEPYNEESGRRKLNIDEFNNANLICSIFKGFINKRKAGESDHREENFINIVESLIYSFVIDETKKDKRGDYICDYKDDPKYFPVTYYAINSIGAELYQAMRNLDKELNGNNAYKTSDDIDSEYANLLK